MSSPHNWPHSPQSLREHGRHPLREREKLEKTGPAHDKRTDLTQSPRTGYPVVVVAQSRCSDMSTSLP